MPRPVILFDAGNTLIVEQPDTRPMVQWDTIEAVPGAGEALRSLCSTHTLIVASNADVSTGELARQALARLSLDTYFSHIFTSVDLNLRKPDPLFFQAILDRTGADPERSVMVGDFYQNDIVGAKAAGLKAVWLNPTCLEAPGGVPVQDAEVSSMHDLAAVFTIPFLPNMATCEAWLVEEGANERLLCHVRAVAFAGYHLACCIRAAGIPIDPLLVHRGALLHDLDKFTHQSRGFDHGEYAGLLLDKRGWPQLANIARHHLIRTSNSRMQPVTLEEKVVNYADKVVEGDDIVGLLPRIRALKQRYPAFAEEMESSLPLMMELEKELCNLAGIPAEELYAEIRNGWQANHS